MENKIKTVNDTSLTKDTIASKSKSKFDYIVFGKYCGHCIGECATMYKLDVVNDKLLVDHTDSYRNSQNSSDMKFDSIVHDTSKFIFAQQILDSIPDYMLESTELSERWGCPDCADGCGIFFEFKKDSLVKQFYIDYQTEQLTGDRKEFAEYLKNKLSQIN